MGTETDAELKRAVLLAVLVLCIVNSWHSAFFPFFFVFVFSFRDEKLGANHLKSIKCTVH